MLPPSPDVQHGNNFDFVAKLEPSTETAQVTAPTYRLYKRRFAGLAGLLILNIVAGMVTPWFGPISYQVATDFGFTLNQVNWLGNITSCIFLPAALLVPDICSRYGLRRCCDVGVLCLLLSAWIRYAGTARDLNSGSAYTLIFLGQVFGSIAQPIFQVIGPKYSEAWFDLKGRTTATMIVAISNPIGGALGQLLSPIVGSTRQSILVLGIITTAVIPVVFLISAAPPIPPTYAGSKPPEPLSSLVRAMVGLSTSEDAQMTIRERIDFLILSLCFGALAGSVTSFSILTGEIMQPAGYSASESGLLGACVLLTGIVAAIISAPLFDCVFTHRLALVSKLSIPVIAACWLSLVWAVRPHNLGCLFAIMAILGAFSLILLPVGLELSVELTRNANASSAILWTAANIFGIIIVLVEGALRDRNPPFSMRRALIFNGALVVVCSSSVVFLQGKEVRKLRDEQELLR